MNTKTKEIDVDLNAYKRELRVVKFDCVPHPEFAYYGICLVTYDIWDRFLTYSDPIEVKNLNFKDLRDLVLIQLEDALSKPIVLQSDMDIGRHLKFKPYKTLNE